MPLSHQINITIIKRVLIQVTQGFLLPRSVDLENEMGIDFTLTFGGSVYFGVGGGGRVSFNFSEFWRQIRDEEQDY